MAKFGGKSRVGAAARIKREGEEMRVSERTWAGAMEAAVGRVLD